MSMKLKVLESIKWLFLAQIMSQIVRVCVTIFVIRNLSSQDMAYVALAQSVMGFVEIFSTLGLTTAIISRKNITLIDLRNIYGLILLVNIALAVFVLLGAGFFANFYKVPELKPILQVSSLGLLIGATGSVAGALLAKDMRFKEISFIQLVSGLSGASMSYYFITHGYSYWSIIAGGFFSILMRAILQMIICGQLILPRLSFGESREHLTFGGYVMAGGIAWYLYVSLDVVIAGKIWTPEVLGFYAVAIQLAVMPLNRLLPILKTVALPAFSKTFAEDSHKLEDYLVKSLRLAMAIIFPIYFGISAVAFLLIPVLLGEQWSAAALPLAFVAIAAPFRFILELQGPAVIAKGYSRENFKCTTLIASVMISFYFIASYLSNAPASLAMVWALPYPVLIFFVSRYYCKIMEVDFLRILKAISASFFASLTMLIVVLAYINIFSSSPFLLVSACCLGIIIYLASIYCIDKPMIEEYVRLLKKNKVN